MSENRDFDFSGGSRDRCPVCEAEVPVEATDHFGEARCPGCGELLFWLRIRREVVAFYREPEGTRLRDRLIKTYVKVLSVDPAQITPKQPLFLDRGADSLDVVELIMELEEGEHEGL